MHTTGATLPATFPKGEHVPGCFYSIGGRMVSKESEIYQDAMKMASIGYGPMDAIIWDYCLNETHFDRKHWETIQNARRAWSV